MKRILTALFLSVTLSCSPLLADPVTVLAETSVVVDNKTCKVLKIRTPEAVTLKVVASESKEIWASEPLGTDDQSFFMDDKASTLMAVDLNGDSVPELITAAMIGPESSALYVFSYNNADKKFVGMNFRQEDFVRDFAVSDMIDDNPNFRFTSTDKVRVLGKQYSEEDGPSPAFYFFELKDGEFVGSGVTLVSETTDATDAPVAPTDTTKDKKEGAVLPSNG